MARASRATRDRMSGSVYILPCSVNVLHHLCIHGVCNSRQGDTDKGSKILEATKGSSMVVMSVVLAYRSCFFCVSGHTSEWCAYIHVHHISKFYHQDISAEFHPQMFISKF